jgi:hypothetical protein
VYVGWIKQVSPNVHEQPIWGYKLEYRSSDLKMVAAGSSVTLKKFYLLQ